MPKINTPGEGKERKKENRGMLSSQLNVVASQFQLIIMQLK